MDQKKIKELIDGGIEILLSRDNFEDSLKLSIKNHTTKNQTINLSREEIDKLGRELIQLNKKRTEVLFYSIDLEKSIDSILTKILFEEKRNENSVLFDILFLKSTYVSFFHKWKILKELLKSSSKFKKFYDSELFDKIKQLIELRNNYSHGEVYYNYEKSNFYLRYYKNDKINEQKLDDIFIRKINNIMKDCSKGLVEISNKITEMEKESI